MNIALQMHILRKLGDMNTQLNFCSQKGIHYVQTYDFQGQDPEQFKRDLSWYHIEPISAHFSLKKLKEERDVVFSYLKELKVPYCVISHPQSDDIKVWQDFFNYLDELIYDLQAIDVRVAYHNHDHEFFTTFKGQNVFEMMMERQYGLYWEADIAWLFAAEQDPTSWLSRYSNRIRQVDIKDYDGRNAAGKPIFCPLGLGSTRVRNVLNFCKESELSAYIIGSDDNQDIDKFVTEGRAFLNRQLDS